MQVWSIYTVACAHMWDYSFNEWCRLRTANKSVITCLGLWWQSLCWWQLSENEQERITFAFHPALAWSPLCRGHLGRNATILPVIKLLIQPQCAHSHLIFQSIHGLVSFHTATASYPPIPAESKGEEPLLKHLSHERDHRVHRDTTFSYFIYFIGLSLSDPGRWSNILRITFVLRSLPLG